MGKIKVYVTGAGVTSEEMMKVRRESDKEVVAVTDEYSETEYVFDKKTGKEKAQKSPFGFSWRIDPII